MTKPKTMVVTKEQVIQAIATEPLLQAGVWTEYDKYDDDERRNPKECKVCAVGAVLRSLGAKDIEGSACNTDTALRLYSGSDYKRIDEVAFAAAQPLEKISMAFEGAAQDALKEGYSKEEATELARTHAILTAEAFLPAKIVVDII